MEEGVGLVCFALFCLILFCFPAFFSITYTIWRKCVDDGREQNKVIYMLKAEETTMWGQSVISSAGFELRYRHINEGSGWK